MNRTSPYYFRRSVLSLLISALIYAQPGMAAFTTNVIGVVNDETVDGNPHVSGKPKFEYANMVEDIREKVSVEMERFFPKNDDE